MKIKGYQPKTEEQAIGWLLEETTEVIRAIAQCMRFHPDKIYDDDDHDPKRTNREILLDEMADLDRAAKEAEAWLDKIGR